MSKVERVLKEELVPVPNEQLEESLMWWLILGTFANAGLKDADHKSQLATHQNTLITMQFVLQNLPIEKLLYLIENQTRANQLFFDGEMNC